MHLRSPDDVCAAIAAHMLGTVDGSGTLGGIALHRHQREAARRLRAIIRACGGALLADEAGLGKTFVALAVSVDFGRPTVVAPASLRAMWRGACDRAGMEHRFVSMEMLGHGSTVPPSDFIIVDEAHHFRNRGTRRYARLAEACARAPVLLVSATPVQNAVDDLRRMLALVLGQAAHALGVDDLTRLIVRRGAASVVTGSPLPRVAEPEPITIDGDADCLEQLCELPPPLPPSDGGHAHALLTLSLARQWASSRAALQAALTRRLAMARAMEDGLAAGRRLSRADLSLWRYADGAQQLAFAELADDGGQASGDMLEQVRAHADAVRSLLAWLRNQPDVDRLRADRLATIVRKHPGERIVAFSEFVETVATLHRRLAPSLRAAMLTHDGGHLAGGRVSRREVLAQFAPGAQPPPHSRIDLLVTTDVLGEGVDLHGASVVVHLDLTWNPARMEQRVGRLRRLGAARDLITVYQFLPPAPAERLLQLDRRLRAKLGDAARSVGLAGTILPAMAPPGQSVVGRRERVVAVLETWLTDAPIEAKPVAAVRWQHAGAIACVRVAGEVRLVALLDGQIDADPAAELLQALRGQDAVRCSVGDATTALDRIHAWMRRRSVTRSVELDATGVARSRRAILDRVNVIARRARRHERTALNAMLGAARGAATIAMPAGAELVLEELARAPLPDEAWLRAVGEFAIVNGRGRASEPDEVLALLLLLPTA